MVEYKLFPGCTIQNRIPFLEATSRKVLEKLGVTLSNAAFACCPEPVGFQAVDTKAWLALGARNLSLAEAEGKDIVSLCNGCTQTLKAVNHQLQHSAAKKDAVNAALAKVGKSYKGSCTVKHFVEVLIQDVGIDKIKAAVTKPLSNLKVATHTGCHYSRPHEITHCDDPFEPKFLKQIVAATGATVVEHPEEGLCCGTGVAMTDEETAMKLNIRKFKDMKKAGADCLCVICPACFQQFDTKQVNIKKATNEDPAMPVLYLTELLALAMGESAETIGLKNHRAKTESAITKLA